MITPLPYFTPGAVLREIAKVVGVSKDQIETRLGELLGEPVEVMPNDEQRLDVIRRALHTPEAESVIDRARQVASRTSPQGA